jgi:hypothetical protein
LVGENPPHDFTRCKADLLVYGNAGQIIRSHRLAKRRSNASITDLRGTAFVRGALNQDWMEIDSTSIDTPGKLNPPIDPYAMQATGNGQQATGKNADAKPCSTSGQSPVAGSLSPNERVVQFHRQVPSANREHPISDCLRTIPLAKTRFVRTCVAHPAHRINPVRVQYNATATWMLDQPPDSTDDEGNGQRLRFAIGAVPPSSYGNAKFLLTK